MGRTRSRQEEMTRSRRVERAAVRVRGGLTHSGEMHKGRVTICAPKALLAAEHRNVWQKAPRITIVWVVQPKRTVSKPEEDGSVEHSLIRSNPAVGAIAELVKHGGIEPRGVAFLRHLTPVHREEVFGVCQRGRQSRPTPGHYHVAAHTEQPGEARVALCKRPVARPW